MLRCGRGSQEIPPERDDRARCGGAGALARARRHPVSMARADQRERTRPASARAPQRHERRRPRSGHRGRRRRRRAGRQGSGVGHRVTHRCTRVSRRQGGTVRPAAWRTRLQSDADTMRRACVVVFAHRVAGRIRGPADGARVGHPRRVVARRRGSLSHRPHRAWHSADHRAPSWRGQRLPLSLAKRRQSRRTRSRRRCGWRGAAAPRRSLAAQ